MPRRNIVFAQNEIYHLYNRTIAREVVFSSRRNLHKVLEIVDFYRFPQTLRLSKVKKLPQQIKQNYLEAIKNTTSLVEIYSYAFMPNHYHFLVKQLTDNGIIKFISNYQNSFAKYFNLKSDRDGGLFQNRFKAVRIETDEQFMHVSRYIHLNPVTAYLTEFKGLAIYPWTSFHYYVSNTANTDLINQKFLLEFFGSKDKYRDFVADRVDYQRDLALIKDLILE